MKQFPIFGSIVAIVGFLRLLIPPLMQIARIIVNWTTTKEDDKILDEFEQSYLKKFLVLVEWLTSIKTLR